MAPLVQLEAEENRRMKENQKQEDIYVRWEKSLSNKHVAVFNFAFRDDGDLRLVAGDELNLRLDANLLPRQDKNKKDWEGKGVVIRIEEGEIFLEMKTGGVPHTVCSLSYCTSLLSYDHHSIITITVMMVIILIEPSLSTLSNHTPTTLTLPLYPLTPLHIHPCTYTIYIYHHYRYKMALWWSSYGNRPPTTECKPR